MTKLVLVKRKRNVTGSVSFSQQIGFRFTVFNITLCLGLETNSQRGEKWKIFPQICMFFIISCPIFIIFSPLCSV